MKRDYKAVQYKEAGVRERLQVGSDVARGKGPPCAATLAWAADRLVCKATTSLKIPQLLLPCYGYCLAGMDKIRAWSQRVKVLWSTTLFVV